MSAPRKPDRIILLGGQHEPAIELEAKITKDSHFLYHREVSLLNILLETFAEVDLTCRRYESAYQRILKDGTPELPQYVRELNETRGKRQHALIELHVIELSTDFKCFLLLAKATLDKLVPLYSNRFHDGLRQFEKGGSALIACIKRNTKVTNRQELVNLLTETKHDWIDSLIDLRDQYAHYSELPQYRSFALPVGYGSPRGIEDFTPPTVIVAGSVQEATNYLKEIRQKLVLFLHDFLVLCDFSPDREPNTYFKCDDCGKQFATRDKAHRVRTHGPLQILVKEEHKAIHKDYGLVICSACGGETETNLAFWREAGFVMNK